MREKIEGSDASIIVSEISRAGDIYGPQVAILKVKSARKRPGHVENIPRVPLPLLIEKDHKNTSNRMDNIFIDGQPYFLTKPAKINSHSIQSCTG